RKSLLSVRLVTNGFTSCRYPVPAFWRYIKSKGYRMGQDAVGRNKVLVVDTDPCRAEALSQRLRFLTYQPVLTGEEAAAADTIAVLLGDIGKDDSGNGGSERGFRDLISKKPDLPIIVASACEPALPKAKDRPTWFLDTPIRRSQLKQFLVRAS